MRTSKTCFATINGFVIEPGPGSSIQKTMAAVVEDANNLPDFIDRYFNSDSDSDDSNFDGFDVQDIEEALRQGPEWRVRSI